MSTSNHALIFSKVPSGFPVPGQDLTVKDIGFDTSQCPPNSINVEVLYLSLDPYMRGRMRDPSVKSYFPGFQYGKPLDNTGLCRVIKSTTDNYKEGDILIAYVPFQEYATINFDEPPARTPEVIDVASGPDDLRNWLGALGMPGLTAYSSLYEIGHPKKGETIFISSAAGAVGQLVGQIAKHDGLTVIGSVGSDEKLKFLTDDLGFDAGFNYKKEAPGEALARLAPDGIDIYYENVGGEHLSAALDALKDHGRIVASGMISQYNVSEDEAYGVKNLMKIVGKRITFRGFIVGDQEFGPKYKQEHRRNVGKWLKEGTVKAKVSEWVGIDKGAEGILGMLKGENFGKAVLKVKGA